MALRSEFFAGRQGVDAPCVQLFIFFNTGVFPFGKMQEPVDSKTGR